MIINTFERLKEYVEIGGGLTWASFCPSIQEAERKFLLPAIGEDLLRRITDAQAVNALTDKELELLPYLQRPVALLAMYLFVPRAEVMVSDAGVQRLETDSNKSAYKYQVQNLRSSLLDAGYEAIEELLAYLERYAASFPTWENSAERAGLGKLLIRSGRELGTYYTNLRQPQRTYRAMLSMLQTVEDLTMLEAFGDTYDVIRTHNADGTLTMYESMVCGMMKKALVHFAMSKAVIELELRIDDAGITLLGSAADSSQGEDGKRAAADRGRTATLAAQLQETGLQYIQKAKRYLDQNASAAIFPTWYAAMQALKSTPQISDINPYLSGSFAL